MTANGLLQIALYFVILVLLIKPLGLYMARVLNGERTFLDPILRPVERIIYRLSGVDPGQEQHWTTYTAAMLIFNLAGLALLYALQRLQHMLPLNPQDFAPPSPDSAFNTAVSFA
ncbi:MAG: potassium-transporting ATPase subunit KdpA, partial [Candidatus Entotheonellia bacterium]